MLRRKEGLGSQDWRSFLSDQKSRTSRARPFESPSEVWWLLGFWMLLVLRVSEVDMGPKPESETARASAMTAKQGLSRSRLIIIAGVCDVAS